MTDQNLSSNVAENDQLAEVLARLESLLHQERALHYGLARDYHAAQRELRQAETSEMNNPSFHDLRARLFAQQGLFKKAKSSWTIALKLDPGNDAYVAGLTLARRDMDRPRLLRWPLSVLITLFLGGVIVALILAAFGYAYQGKNELASLAVQVETVRSAQELHAARTSDDLDTASGEIRFAVSSSGSAIKEDLEAVDSTLESFSSELSELRSQQSILLEEPSDPPLAVPLNEIAGIRIEPIGEGYRIIFDEALFSEGVSLDPSGSDLLSQLGRLLGSIRGNTLIVVTGFVDDSECVDCFSGNLPLARAEAVAQFLVERTNLSESDLVFSLPGERAKPYPEDTEESALRNRTVILELIPVSG